MRRRSRSGRLIRPSAAILAVAALCRSAPAAEEWPSFVPVPSADWRGPGGGIAILPAACWWLVVLGWVRTVDWVHGDATKRGITPAFWSTACGLPLPVAAVLAWWIPSALAGLAVMLLAWIVPVSLYAFVRNPRVAETERILTPGHARRVVAGLLAPLGIEIAAAASEEGVLPVVDLAAAGGKDAAENDERIAAARALPGFEEFRRQMLAAVVARAAAVVFDIAGDTSVRHEVDGVWGKPRVRQPPRNRREKEAWVEVPPTSRDIGEAMAAAAETVCGLPPGAAKGSGRFTIRVDGRPRNARLTVRPEAHGRQLIIQIESSEAAFKRLTDLGLTEPLAARIGELLAADRGVILLSSPAGAGLTTTADLVVESADRLLRDFISVEDAARPPREIQNVKPVRFDARTGVTPLAALADSMREYPSAIVARDVRDKDLVAELVRLAGEGKLVIISLKASDAVEAITRVLGCGVGPKSLGAVLLGSLSERLVRRLCPKCREQVPPPPQLLERLKLTPEQLPHIHQASPRGCRLCQGSGYLGRTGVFELASGGTLRRSIADGGGPDLLRQAAVRDGMRPLREAAVQLVAEGVTSLEEVQRALAVKSGSTGPAGESSGGAAAAGRVASMRPPTGSPSQ